MRPAPARFPVFRPPPRRLVAVVVLAILVGLVVHRTVADATATVERYGPAAPVAVVRRDVPAGARLRAGDVRFESRPVAHVPADAVTTDPDGERARVDLTAGEVLVASRLAGGDGSSAAALVPDGWRAVPIPMFDAELPAVVGDRVEIIGSFDPALTSRPSRVLVGDALVVDVADDAVTVAMPAPDVTDVAFALVNGIVLLALVG